MQITDVRVRRIEREGRMKAIVSITLDNESIVLEKYQATASGLDEDGAAGQA